MEIAEYLLALQNETAPDPFTDINAYSYALNNGSHSCMNSMRIIWVCICMYMYMYMYVFITKHVMIYT